MESDLHDGAVEISADDQGTELGPGAEIGEGGDGAGEVEDEEVAE